MGEFSTDADAIMNAVEAGEDPSQIPVDGGEQTTEQAAPTFRKEFTANGRQVSVNDESKYDKWAQQGYNYSQQMEAFNKEKSDFEAQRTQWSQENETRLSRFAEVDKFAQENPDWWNHVENSWNTRETHGMAPEIQDAVNKVLEPHLAEVSEMKKFVHEQHVRQEEEKAAAEDAELQAQYKALQDEFPEIDFTAVDDTGQSFEAQIVNHANAHGLPTIKAAFLDYHHAHLQNLYVQRGMKQAEDARAKQNKAGILGRTPAPTQNGLADTLANPRNKSWEDVEKEAAAALGIT
jgi:hypothetical protein